MIKIKFIALLFLICLITSLAADPGEHYFSFEFENRTELEILTKLISIDKISGKTIYAYANNQQFNQFLELDIDYTPLPHPGRLITPEMSADLQKLSAWDSYPTYEAYLEMMYQFAEDYPDICTIINAGQSVQGRDILFAKISDNINENENEPEFMYTSSMHGDELTGYILMLRLIDYLLNNYGTDDRITNIVNEIEIWINPLANPDGTYYGGNHTVYGSRRNNANGVDLNRNFADPEDGDHPDGNPWQPENIIMMELSAAQNFVLAANFHGGAEVMNYPWDTWYRRHADDIWYQAISHTYADNAQENSPPGYMSGFNDGITNGYDWYTISGGRQDFMNYFRNCREVTMEISETKLPPASQLPDFWEYNHESLLLYLEECLYGFRGIISNLEGNPVYASIEVIDHDLDNSWIYSDKILGNYHRLIASGTWDIEVTAYAYSNNYQQNISVSENEITVLNIIMQPAPDAINLTGQVLDSDTGAIIPDATIEVLHVPVAPATSDQSGLYSLYLLAGDFQFRVSAPGYLESEFSLTIDEMNNEYDFILNSGPVIGVNLEAIFKEMPVNSEDLEIIILTNEGGGILNYEIYLEQDERDLTGCYISCSSSTFSPGQEVEWVFTVFNNSPDGEWIKDIFIEFPQNVTVNEASNFSGGSGGDLFYDGATGAGEEIHWHGETALGYGVLHEDETAQAVVEVSIAPQYTGEIILNYHIIGDGYGEEPHDIFNSISLTYPLNWININPDSGSLDSGASDEIAVVFNTNEVDPSNYNCEIIIEQENSNFVSIPVQLTVISTSAQDISIPTKASLQNNYPNPFNPSTIISFNIGSETQAALEIFNLKGQKINTLLNSFVPSGQYSIEWNGTDNEGVPVSSGIYFYSLTTETGSAVKRMILLK
ncbi:MAG: hypothetical protein APR54_02610 [Candidatus Cloacimonas sp. SDB]|nr:MAG: hypothetical protein APR54_02610 [Candidatus Cloacimonas sp. SDB]